MKEEMKFVMILGALALFLSMGCTDPQRKGPKETAQFFLDAVSAGDYDRAKEVCTEGTKENLSLFETFSGFGANPMSGASEVIKEEINGEYATAYYEKEGKEHYIKLHKNGGKWYVIANKADLSAGDLKEDDDASQNEEPNTLGNDEEEDPADQFKSLRDGKSAEEIAQSFLTSYAYSDFEKAKRFASKSSGDAIDMQSALGSGKDAPQTITTKFKLLRVEEKGDYASAYYLDGKSDQEKELKLGKDKHGNWEVIMTKSDFSE